MNADAFRHFYEYHFTENRKIWETYILPLSQEQFTQPVVESARDTPAFRQGEGVRLVLSGRCNYDGFPEGRERFK